MTFNYLKCSSIFNNNLLILLQILPQTDIRKYKDKPLFRLAGFWNWYFCYGHIIKLRVPRSLRSSVTNVFLTATLLITPNQEDLLGRSSWYGIFQEPVTFAWDLFFFEFKRNSWFVNHITNENNRSGYSLKRKRIQYQPTLLPRFQPSVTNSKKN